MKKILLILTALTSMSAFADSATTAVGSFKGNLIIATETIDVKVVDVEVVHQFCNFFGSTCAGGPRQVQQLPIVAIESKEGQIITISNESVTEISASKLGNKFSSCKVNLVIQGVSIKEGRPISGSYNLAFFNDKEICSSQEQMTKAIREKLSKSLVVKDGVSFVNIQPTSSK